MNNLLKPLFLYLLMKFTNLVNSLFPNSIEINTNDSHLTYNSNNMVLQKDTSYPVPSIKPEPCPKETKDYINAQVARLGGIIEWVDAENGGSYYRTTFDDDASAQEFDEIMMNLLQNGISEDELEEFQSNHEKYKSIKIDQDIQDMVNDISNNNKNSK